MFHDGLLLHHYGLVKLFLFLQPRPCLLLDGLDCFLVLGIDEVLDFGGEGLSELLEEFGLFLVDCQGDLQVVLEPDDVVSKGGVDVFHFLFEVGL